MDENIEINGTIATRTSKEPIVLTDGEYILVKALNELSKQIARLAEK